MQSTCDTSITFRVRFNHTAESNSMQGFVWFRLVGESSKVFHSLIAGFPFFEIVF
jgi:hypothetical protein